MRGRDFQLKKFRYGFQQQEKDDEVKGPGNSYDFKNRIYDSRLGRFLSIDPVSDEYPGTSVYAFSENQVIAYIEMEGLQKANYAKRRKKPKMGRDFSGVGWLGKIFGMSARGKYFKNTVWPGKVKPKEPIKEAEEEKEEQDQTVKETVIKTVIKKGELVVPVDEDRANQDMTATVDTDGGGYRIELDSYNVPDEITITDANTGAVLYHKKKRNMTKFKVPDGVDQINIEIKSNPDKDSQYNLQVKKKGLIKKTTTIEKENGKVVSKDVDEEEAPDGAREGQKTKKVTKTIEKD